MMRQFPYFCRDRDGSSTVEFVLIFPAIVTLVFGVVESGWLMTRYMMLDRGLDIAIREVRLGIMTDPSHDNIRSAICEYSRILPDCEETLVIEMVKMESFNLETKCFPRNEETPNPVISIDPGQRITPEIMFIRACSNVDPMLPGLEFGLLLPKDPDTNAHQMVAYSAFVNEPK